MARVRSVPRLAGWSQWVWYCSLGEAGRQGRAAGHSQCAATSHTTSLNPPASPRMGDLGKKLVGQILERHIRGEEVFRQGERARRGSALA